MCRRRPIRRDRRLRQRVRPVSRPRSRRRSETEGDVCATVAPPSLLDSAELGDSFFDRLELLDEGNGRVLLVIEVLRLLEDVGGVGLRHHNDAVFIGGDDIASIHFHARARHRSEEHTSELQSLSLPAALPIWSCAFLRTSAAWAFGTTTTPSSSAVTISPAFTFTPAHVTDRKSTRLNSSHFPYPPLFRSGPAPS